MPARRPFEIGRCACGASVRHDSFRDRESYLAFYRHGHGRCQDCCDTAVFAPPDAVTMPIPMGRGAVGVQRARDGDVLAAFIPFFFTRPGTLASWEGRNICSFGPGSGSSDPWDELSSMSVPLDGHQVRVQGSGGFGKPLVADCLGVLDLVIALDAAEAKSLATISGAADSAIHLGLDDAFDWLEVFGMPLQPLVRFALHARFERWLPDMRTDVSALRTCSWLGAALSLPVPRSESLTVMDWVLRRDVPGERL